jgi:predicted transcriptional regulator of viral defense system
MVSLASGLWAPVPSEYLTWGAPPAIDIIDSMMRYMKIDYYIGWLSAAALHGASHHAPQAFQVAVSRAIRARSIGRSNLLFYRRDNVGFAATVQSETRSGTVSVSSRETTMLDIAADIGLVGGIDNAANLIIELCESHIPDFDVIDKLSERYPASAVRRLGYLMSRFTDIAEVERLKAACAGRKAAVSLLDPQSANTGNIDKHWRLKINREVDPDV